jgi:deazaflavin-dependent oxidoreductase (nitroreductase family)
LQARAYGIDRTCATEAGSRKADDEADPLRRKTGQPHEVTIWFVLDGDRLYIGTANVNRQWVQNVQKTPQVKLSIADENVEGTARFLTDRAEHERAMAAIRRKYWMFRPIIELGRFLAAIGLMRDKTGSFEVLLAG